MIKPLGLLGVLVALLEHGFGLLALGLGWAGKGLVVVRGGEEVLAGGWGVQVQVL